MSQSILKKQRAFTLIELMIVVAIISILAAITYPSYQDSVRQARRATAQADLLELANFMERTFTESNEYDPTGFALPFSDSPKTGTTFYDLSLSAVNTTTFTLQAAPVASSAQAADTCGNLTLTNAGVKGSVGPVASCW